MISRCFISRPTLYRGSLYRAHINYNNTYPNSTCPRQQEHVPKIIKKWPRPGVTLHNKRGRFVRKLSGCWAYCCTRSRTASIWMAEVQYVANFTLKGGIAAILDGYAYSICSLPCFWQNKRRLVFCGRDNYWIKFIWARYKLPRYNVRRDIKHRDICFVNKNCALYFILPTKPQHLK